MLRKACMPEEFGAQAIQYMYYFAIYIMAVANMILYKVVYD